MARIPIVNEHDEIIGYKERDAVAQGDIYRVSALWITDEHGRILLAKRSHQKKNDPGKWGPAVAGTVEEGETYESNILKEAEEELGLKDVRPRFLEKFPVSKERHFFRSWYTLTIPSTTPLTLQEEEVAEIKWWGREELRQMIAEHPEEFVMSAPQWLERF